ncbi:aminotransferase class-V [Apiospora arundinis]
MGLKRETTYYEAAAEAARGGQQSPRREAHRPQRIKERSRHPAPHLEENQKRRFNRISDLPRHLDHAAPRDADLIQELKQQWLAVEPPHERTHTPKLATAAMKKHIRKTHTASRSQ